MVKLKKTEVIEDSKINNDSLTSKKSSKRKKQIHKTIGSCFVLMPFSEPFNTYYKSIIKPAVNNAKLDSLRGDSLFRPSPIMADIWQMIQEAKLLVAELTGKNPNVFYELGLAHAIGKPVVLLSETIEDVPFDLQSLRVIIYDKDDPTWGSKLKTKLTKSINETINTPVDSVPQMFRKSVKSQAPVDTGLSSRISALERRISLWEIEGRPSHQQNLFEELPRSVREIRERFHMISSPKEAEMAVKSALNIGISPKMIEIYLSESVPPNEVKRILQQFGLK
jgi:hypothetical protein